jgi:sugar phosphate isomerase/epimerase
MKPTLSTVCSLDAPLETILEDYAAGGCRSIDLWLGHAEAFLRSHDESALADCLAARSLDVAAVSFQGGLFAADIERGREHWRLFAEQLAFCGRLSVPVLVVAGDISGPLGPADLGRLSGTLVEAARMAADAGVRLALEFQARAGFPTNLQSAVALVEDVGLPSLGLCLDWFHYTVGPSKPLDLHLLTPDTLAHVQLSDIADVPREMAGDTDRILPAEGSSPPHELITLLAAMPYTAAVTIETMNPALWRVPPRQFGEIAMTALRRILGQASMD